MTNNKWSNKEQEEDSRPFPTCGECGMCVGAAVVEGSNSPIYTTPGQSQSLSIPTPVPASPSSLLVPPR